MGLSIAKSLVAPYLCAVDSSGDVWVASTSSVSASTIIGLFEATPSGTSLPNGSLWEDALANCTGGGPEREDSSYEEKRLVSHDLYTTAPLSVSTSILFTGE